MAAAVVAAGLVVVAVIIMAAAVAVPLIQVILGLLYHNMVFLEMLIHTMYLGLEQQEQEME